MDYIIVAAHGRQSPAPGIYKLMKYDQIRFLCSNL